MKIMVLHIFSYEILIPSENSSVEFTIHNFMSANAKRNNLDMNSNYANGMHYYSVPISIMWEDTLL